MNWYLINVLFRKELLEIWRDKKTLLRVILLPMFLYPIIILFVTQVSSIQSRKINATKIQLTISGNFNGTPLYDSLALDSQFILVNSKASFTKDSLPAGITIVQSEPTVEDSSLHLILYYDATSDYTRTAKEKIERLIVRLNTRLVDERLRQLHLSTSFIKPLDVSFESTASKEKTTGNIIGKIIPGVLMLFIFIGSVYISMDITAGEKERKTLQSLYAAPINSYEIITGKFLAVYVVSLGTAFANLFGMLLSVALLVISSGTEALQKTGLSINAVGILWLVLLIVIMTGIISALSLSVISMARSHKEATSYMSPLMIVLMLPMMVYNLPAMELGITTSMIPLLNILLSMNEILKDTYSPSLVFTVVAISACYLIFVLMAAHKIFSSEGVITGEKVNYKILLEAKKNNRKVFGVFEALIFFAAIFLCYIYAGTPIYLNTNILIGIPLTNIFVLGLGSFITLKLFKINVRESFYPKIPSIQSIIGTTLMGIGIYFSMVVLTSNIMGEEFIRAFAEKTRPLMETNTVLGLILIAAFPAVFEELIFRGIVFHGLRQQLGPIAVILISSAAFAMMHIDLERLFHTFMVGLVLGVVMWKSKNIFLCILLHFLLNGTAFIVGKSQTLGTLFAENMMLFTAGGFVVFGLGVVIFYMGTVEDKNAD